MKNLKICVFLSALVVARCAALPFDQAATIETTNSSLDDQAPPNDLDISPEPLGEVKHDIINEDQSSADEQKSSDTNASSLDETESFDDDTKSSNDFKELNDDTMSSIDVLNNEFASDLSQEEDEVRERFWFFGNKKPLKKKPALIKPAQNHNVHIQKPHEVFDKPLFEPHTEDIHHENPGLIKPFIDKITKPIKAVLNKPAEIAAHILNKPHKPFVGAEILAEKPSLVDHIKKPIEHILNKPAEIAANVFNKPHVVTAFEHEHGGLSGEAAESGSGFLNKPHDVHEEDPHHDTLGYKPIADDIKKPIESLLHKPAEIVSDLLNKPHNVPVHGDVIHHQKPDITTIVDGIKKPIETLLHKPAEIVSHLLNKPHNDPLTDVATHHESQKPGLIKPIVDHIKKPIDAVFQKPVSLIKPENFDSVIHFPFEDVEEPWDLTYNLKPSKPAKPVFEEIEEPFGALLDQLYSQPQQPWGPYYSNSVPMNSFYDGIHYFRPNFELFRDQLYKSKAEKEPAWAHRDSTLRQNPWNSRSSWSQSSNYGIPGALLPRTLVSDAQTPYETGVYEPNFFAYPYGAYGR